MTDIDLSHHRRPKLLDNPENWRVDVGGRIEFFDKATGKWIAKPQQSTTQLREGFHK